jgi:glyoxylase-like metal-dependent hydrolase (beta-lactamase superfamily II)
MNPAYQVLLGDPQDNCSYMDGLAKVFDFPYVKAEGSISIGGIDIDVLSTPGHTMGSVCYMFREEDKQYLFTGDTVFAGSVGRTDMAGGSFALLNKSIEAVSKLDPETLICPGHGPESTVGDEVKYNPFFAG